MLAVVMNGQSVQAGSSGASSELAAMLQRTGPPATAMSDKTPNVRSNPAEQWYVNIQRVKMTMRDALVAADEQDEAVKAMLASSRSLMDKLLTGSDPKISICTSIAEMLRNWAPQLAKQCDLFAITLTAQAQAPVGAGAPPAAASPLGGGTTAPAPAMASPVPPQGAPTVPATA